jgi:hypothetical protein
MRSRSNKFGCAMSFLAYPNLYDLALIESVIEKEMNRQCRDRMRDMLKILKTLASLMKFGRLATKFPPAELEHFGENALNVVKSWNQPFEDIDGLLNFEHDEAKKYIEIWVNDREMNEFVDCPTTQEQRQVVFVLFIKVYTTQV